MSKEEIRLIRVAVKINKENRVEGVWESTDMTHMEKGVLLLELENIVDKLKADWCESDFIQQDYEN